MPLRGAHASSVLQAVRHMALSLPRCQAIGKGESACGDNSVEQREDSRMASGVVNVHECDGTANWGDSFVAKFGSGIEVMGELVGRRDYSA